ncbi:MAG: ribosome-associated protein [Frankiaceae bacterium]|nr:ribosome-associated protein [Frankiaceae bacterium]
MTASPRALELARAAANAAADKLATDIVVLDVSEQLVITDCFVVASAASDRQVVAVIDAIEGALRDLDAKPLRREGQKEARWVLLDYADIVVHVQHVEQRLYYSLERLWKDCPSVSFEGATADLRSAVGDS